MYTCQCFSQLGKKIDYLVWSCSNGLKEIGLLIQSVLKVSAIDLVTVADQKSFGKKEVKQRQKTNRNDESNLNI